MAVVKEGNTAGEAEDEVITSASPIQSEWLPRKNGAWNGSSTQPETA